jgi:ribosome maturation factor RimP
LKKEILEIIDNVVQNTAYFVVDVNIVSVKQIPHIKLLIDSDQGIGIDECAEISRKIVAEIEAVNLLPNFEIEVSSPGVGEPLKLLRQYHKNIGRHIKVVTNDNKILFGILEKVNEDTIEVRQETKSKNKITKAEENVNIRFSDIKRANIEIVF